MTVAINHEVKTVVQKRIHKEVLTDVTQRTYQHRMAITGLGMLNAEEIERGLAMNMIDKEPERHEIEALLPWHAAGTLSRRDADRVEQALADDPELARRYDLVRLELAETIYLNKTLGAPSTRATKKLFAAIDAEEARAPRTRLRQSSETPAPGDRLAVSVAAPRAASPLPRATRVGWDRPVNEFMQPDRPPARCYAETGRG
jgi:hypothetical protein